MRRVAAATAAGAGRGIDVARARAHAAARARRPGARRIVARAGRASPVAARRPFAARVGGPNTVMRTRSSRRSACQRLERDLGPDAVRVADAEGDAPVVASQRQRQQRVGHRAVAHRDALGEQQPAVDAARSGRGRRRWRTASVSPVAMMRATRNGVRGDRAVGIGRFASAAARADGGSDAARRCWPRAARRSGLRASRASRPRRCRPAAPRARSPRCVMR